MRAARAGKGPRDLKFGFRARARRRPSAAKRAKHLARLERHLILARRIREAIAHESGAEVGGPGEADGGPLRFREPLDVQREQLVEDGADPGHRVGEKAAQAEAPQPERASSSVVLGVGVLLSLLLLLLLGCIVILVLEVLVVDECARDRPHQPQREREREQRHERARRCTRERAQATARLDERLIERDRQVHRTRAQWPRAERARRRDEGPQLRAPALARQRFCGRARSQSALRGQPP